MKMKALKSHTYGGRTVHAGEVFHARDKDARLLRALRRAVVHVEDVAADPEPEKSQDAAIAKPRRPYKRRDMKAEG